MSKTTRALLLAFLISVSIVGNPGYAKAADTQTHSALLPKSSIPWKHIGPGWLIGIRQSKPNAYGKFDSNGMRDPNQTVDVVLVSPKSRTYSALRIAPPYTFQLVDWSRDGRHVLTWTPSGYSILSLTTGVSRPVPTTRDYWALHFLGSSSTKFVGDYCIRNGAKCYFSLFDVTGHSITKPKSLRGLTGNSEGPVAPWGRSFVTFNKKQALLFDQYGKLRLRENIPNGPLGEYCGISSFLTTTEIAWNCNNFVSQTDSRFNVDFYVTNLKSHKTVKVASGRKLVGQPYDLYRICGRYYVSHGGPSDIQSVAQVNRRGVIRESERNSVSMAIIDSHGCLMRGYKWGLLQVNVKTKKGKTIVSSVFDPNSGLTGDYYLAWG